MMIKHPPDQIETSETGQPKNVGDAHDEKRGGEAAKDQIFYAGLQRHDIAALISDEDVEGDGDELERDEEENEIVGRGEQHQTDRGEKRQYDKFTAAAGKRVLYLVAHPDDQCRDREKKEMEELGRAVPLGHTTPEKRVGAVQHQGVESGKGDAGQRRESDDAGRERKKGFGQQQAHGPDREKDLRGHVTDVGIGDKIKHRRLFYGGHERQDRDAGLDDMDQQKTA